MIVTTLLPMLAISLAGLAGEMRTTTSPDRADIGSGSDGARPQRAILFIIDGLHKDAPSRLELPVFNELVPQGSLIGQTTVIMPGHPTHGDYARVHTSSFPNPMMMAGSAFLREGQPMLQHSFSHTAFIVNTFAYRSISHDYDYAVQRTERDAFPVDTALDLLDRHEDIDFMRIHLQESGSAGYAVVNAEEGTPWRFDLWHAESPFVAAVREADRQLGRFVEQLKQRGLWESTLLVVTSDHGQTDSGWHPLLPEDSWLHPTLFLGPGIAQGRVVKRADQIDLAPTIAALMGVEAPDTGGGAGRVIGEVTDTCRGQADGSQPGSGNPPKAASQLPKAESQLLEGSSRLLELNRVLAREMIAGAKLTLAAREKPWLNSMAMILERDFYSMDRIMQWHELDSLEELIRHNRRIVERMESILKENAL